LGVDTHLDLHVAVALDQLGREKPPGRFDRADDQVARRTAEGKSRREIMRCLCKRHIAREVYRVVVASVSPSLIGASTTATSPT
jgi:hypothetical protein